MQTACSSVRSARTIFLCVFFVIVTNVVGEREMTSWRRRQETDTCPLPVRAEEAGEERWTPAILCHPAAPTAAPRLSFDLGAPATFHPRDRSRSKVRSRLTATAHRDTEHPSSQPITILSGTADPNMETVSQFQCPSPPVPVWTPE